MGDAALAGSAVGTPAGPASCSVDSAAGPCWLWFVACCSGSSVCAEASARSLEGSATRRQRPAMPSSRSVGDSSRWLPAEPTCFSGTDGPFLSTPKNAIPCPRPTP